MMATAKKFEYPAPPPPKAYKLVLELDESEAKTLADILGLVGGPPHSRVRHANGVLVALESAGYVSDCYAPDKFGEIYFR
jgi:hypothetical protein